MARYLTIPQEVMIEGNDEQGRTISRPFAWVDFLKGLMGDQRFIQSSDDIFFAIDLRAKLLKCLCPGMIVELTDKEWGVLEPIAKRPPFISIIAFQIETYFRAICGATTTRPSVLASKEETNATDEMKEAKTAE